MKQLRVGLFALEDGPYVEGLTDGSLWNGFAVVWMTRLQAEALLDEYDEIDGGFQKDDSLVIDQEGEEEVIEPDSRGLYSFEGWTFSEAD